MTIVESSSVSPVRSAANPPGPSRRGRIDIDTLPVPLEGSIKVSAWVDPYLETHGHDIRSSYVELFWLGILGPSATVLLRRLSTGLDHAPNGYLLPIVDTARSIGVGPPTNRQSTFVKALHRCVLFRVARFAGSDLQVRRQLPTLNHSQLRRLPESLQSVHRALSERHPDRVTTR